MEKVEALAGKDVIHRHIINQYIIRQACFFAFLGHIRQSEKQRIDLVTTIPVSHLKIHVERRFWLCAKEVLVIEKCLSFMVGK